MPSAISWVAGVDGCPAGWMVVLRPRDNAGQASVQLVPRFADILMLDPAPEIIAVDIPVGLPNLGSPGGRLADIEARRNLGERQSAVFTVPARAAIVETEYAAACAASLAHSNPLRKVSKQMFHLFPKIREVDALMTPELQSRVVECHPELAFWALNGKRPLALPKKVKSRPDAAGLALRRMLLEGAGYLPALLTHRSAKLSQAGPDDLLDAAACAWSAARIARGEGFRFPSEPPFDGHGLRMEIWC